MIVNITTKNFNASENLKNTIEKKLSKLDKYFSKNVTANVVISNEKGKRQKLEATITAAGMIFRAEEVNTDIYYCIDTAVDKLATQMSRFKDKLIKKHKDQKEILFSQLPDYKLEEEENSIVRRKSVHLNPMSEEEAILQMELLAHSFFVFLSDKDGKVNVLYRREDGNYGLLETEV